MQNGTDNNAIKYDFIYDSLQKDDLPYYVHTVHSVLLAITLYCWQSLRCWQQVWHSLCIVGNYCTVCNKSGIHSVLLAITLYCWQSLCTVGNDSVLLAMTTVGNDSVLLAMTLYCWQSLPCWQSLCTVGNDCTVGNNSVLLAITLFCWQ